MGETWLLHEMDGVGGSASGSLLCVGVCERKYVGDCYMHVTAECHFVCLMPEERLNACGQVIDHHRTPNPSTDSFKSSKKTWKKSSNVKNCSVGVND